jgi:hypothetical protein
MIGESYGWMEDKEGRERKEGWTETETERERERDVRHVIATHAGTLLV